VDRPRPPSDNVCDESTAVAHQLHVYTEVAFPVSVYLSNVRSWRLNCYMGAVDRSDDSWQSGPSVECLHNIISLLVSGWKIDILRTQCCNSSCHTVDDATCGGLVNVKRVANDQLEAACCIKAQCDQQLVHWADALVPLGVKLQLVLYLTQK